MNKEHHFETNLRWTGNKGEGTTSYEAYSRDHVITIEGKPDIPASSAPAFRGNGSYHNPEEMLVASLSSCHMLWYLHLCADSGIKVTEYMDKATGKMLVEKGGAGRFTEVTLHPRITVTEDWMVEKAIGLHKEANKKCFIANSCNFPVHHFPNCQVKVHSQAEQGGGRAVS